MQDFISRNRADPRNRWIFNIIDGRVPVTEIVLAVRSEWTLCRDVGGIDGKWLVVLHDPKLHSLRDFRSHHINLLLSIRKEVRSILQMHYQDHSVTEFNFFVHYLPSTFQAHIHVHCPQMMGTRPDESRINSRRHNLRHIVRNLVKDDLYYTKCLLLANMCKTTKTAAIYSSLSSEASDKILFK